jgi:hypothetical protein
MEQGGKSKGKHAGAIFCISHETAFDDRNFSYQDAGGDAMCARFACVLEQFLILFLRRQRSGLVDQHDRNVIPDFIKKLTGCAGKAVLVFCKLDRPLAFGTGDDVKKLLADHGIGSV